MKTKFILLFVIVAFISSCKQESTSKEVSKNASVIISGRITNASSKKIELSNTKMFSVEPNEKFAIALKEDGTFIDTLTVTPGHYLLREGQNNVSLYLYNDVNITINCDSKDFNKSLKLSGEGAGVAQYLFDKNKIVQKAYEPNSSGDNIYNNEESDFKEKITKVKNELSKLLEGNKEIPENVKAIEKREINYIFVDFINRYKGVYAYVSGDSTYVPSKAFTKELDELTYDNEDDFISSRTYAYLLLEYYRDNAFKKEGAQYPSNLELLKSLSNIPNEQIKNTMLMYYGKSSLPRAENLSEMYSFVTTNITNAAYNDKLTALYNELKLLTKGQPSPIFENYENYAGGTNSLKDFSGKYVFIDVWATWCGPCKYEIPYLEKLEKEYHNENIVFVSLSVDRKSAYKAWRKMIKDKNMKGVQLLADKNFNSKFIEDYKISAIPRFILIDPSGNIVSANAPRPSSDAIRPLLNELLGKS